MREPRAPGFGPSRRSRAPDVVSIHPVLQPLHPALAVLAGIVGGLLLGWVVFSVIPRNTLRRARKEGDQLGRAGAAEAGAPQQRAELEAEKKARERREAVDREVADTIAEVRQSQARLTKREDNLERTLAKVTEREGKLDKRETESKK